MRCTNTRYVEHQEELFEVPCGKCLACLTNKRDDWSFRLMQEHRVSKGAVFITLTYHPKFVPDYGVDKNHLQLFMKRLRHKCPGKLRYYAVGEYGTRTQRPHYHIILFNYAEGEDTIRKSWSLRGQEIGIVHLGRVTEASIRYCTKYVIQRSTRKDTTRNKEFALMSRGYGLGAHYLSESMIEWHREGLRNYTMVYGEKKRLPRYYKEKIWYRAHDKQLPALLWVHQDRNALSEKSIQEGKEGEEKNRQILIRLGYHNPDLIIAEMRAAVMDRVLEKVSFTQTI